MRKIYLFCAAGMSTSLLVKKMKDYADSIGYETEIQAFPITEAVVEVPNADVSLLGPQVHYELNHVKSQFPDYIVESINMQAYGLMNGKAVIEQVRKLLGDE